MFGQLWAWCPGAARWVVVVREGVLDLVDVDEVLVVEPLAPAATAPPAAIAPTVTATAMKRLRMNIGCSFLEGGVGRRPISYHTAYK
jgi:hypothetical protein